MNTSTFGIANSAISIFSLVVLVVLLILAAVWLTGKARAFATGGLGVLLATRALNFVGPFLASGSNTLEVMTSFNVISALLTAVSLFLLVLAARAAQKDAGPAVRFGFQPGGVPTQPAPQYRPPTTQEGSPRFPGWSAGGYSGGYQGGGQPDAGASNPPKQP